MQWFSRIIWKQQRTFWFQTRRDTQKHKAIVNQMIRRKQSLVGGSPHRLSGGGDLPGRFMVPLHATSAQVTAAFCLSFIIPCCWPAKTHHSHCRPSPSSSILFILFSPPKSNSWLRLGARRKGWLGNHKTHNKIEFVLYSLPQWGDNSSPVLFWKSIILKTETRDKKLVLCN